MNSLSRSFPDVGPRARALGLLAFLLLGLPAGAAAEDPPDRLRYGFTGALGYGRATGAASDFLDDTWSADFNFFLEKGRFRGGIGYEFHRFRTVGARSLRRGLGGPLLSPRGVLPLAPRACPPLPAGAAGAHAAARPGDPRPRGAGRERVGLQPRARGRDRHQPVRGPRPLAQLRGTAGGRAAARRRGGARLPERVHGTRRPHLEGLRAGRVAGVHGPGPALGRPPQPRPRDRPAAGRLRLRLRPERVLPRLRLRAGQPADVGAEPRARLRVRPEQVRHQQLLPPLERGALLQHRPLDGPRLLGIVLPGGRRQPAVGVLRRDVEDVRERRDLDVARRCRHGRDDPPPRVGHPRQPGQGREPGAPRGQHLPLRHRARLQPRSLPRPVPVPQPGGAARLAPEAAGSPRLARRPPGGKRGGARRRGCEDGALRRPVRRLRERLRQRAAPPVRLVLDADPDQLHGRRRPGRAHDDPRRHPLEALRRLPAGETGRSPSSSTSTT